MISDSTLEVGKYDSDFRDLFFHSFLTGKNSSPLGGTWDGEMDGFHTSHNGLVEKCRRKKVTPKTNSSDFPLKINGCKRKFPLNMIPFQRKC